MRLGESLGVDLDAIRRALRRNPDVDAAITRIGGHRVLTAGDVTRIRELLAANAK